MKLESQQLKKEAKLVAFSASACDRQVLLDLPRCHPSDPLMRSPSGQFAAQRIVRLWLHFATSRNPAIHYWQGIDSMAATMLTAGKNELLCAKVLERIIETFVPQFASSSAIRARVGRLAGMVRFHDPFAAAHLDEACGVQIDHFALPWILTAFAHVFPLSQTCKLWDALLLHREPVTLLMNFTVAVIIASRLQFLNAPDLASSLLLLRQAAQNIVPVMKNSNNNNINTNHNNNSSSNHNNHNSPQQQPHATETGHQHLFANVLSSARKLSQVSPPFCRDWDDLDNENCFDSSRVADFLISRKRETEKIIELEERDNGVRRHRK